MFHKFLQGHSLRSFRSGEIPQLVERDFLMGNPERGFEVLDERINNIELDFVLDETHVIGGVYDRWRALQQQEY